MDWTTASLSQIRGLVRERNLLARQSVSQASEISQLREQLKIALEHWEMYEDEFVDVEREAFDAASAVLESTATGGDDR